MEIVDLRNHPNRDPHYTLESGNILIFPNVGSDLTVEDKEFLRNVHLAGGKLHKNIAYKPALDRVSGFEGSNRDTAARLHSVLRAFSQWAIRFTGEILPRYQPSWKLDYASFRPEEEEGRNLPWKKRNDLLHVDAFPSRPTHGDLILRVFTNINREKSRIWLTSDPFEKLAREEAQKAGLQAIAASAGSGVGNLWRSFMGGLSSIGLPVPDRSPYDRFMLRFHDYLKSSREYQKNCPKYRAVFPPNSTWMVLTDVVPHAVLSGRFAMEQTFLVSRHSLAAPELAPAAILERLSHRELLG